MLTAFQREKIYDGDIAAHFAEFKRRFVAEAATGEGLGISVRDFSTENHIASIIDTRLDVTPNTFDVKAKDEKQTKLILEWLERKVFGNGMNFWERNIDWNKQAEIQGEFYLHFYEKDGQWHVSTIPHQTLYLKIETDKLNTDKVLSYDVFWFPNTVFEKQDGKATERTEGRNAKHIIFSEAGVRTEGMTPEESARYVNNINGLWQLNHHRRLPVLGSPNGRSAVDELMEAQNDIANADTKGQVAGKYAAMKLLCPPTGIDIDEWVRQYSADASRSRVSPGMIKPYPLTAVGGDSHLREHAENLQRKVDHIYELARVPRKKDQGDMRSGKAQLMTHVGLRAYLENMLRFRARQWERFFGNYLALVGEIDDPSQAEITVTYTSFDFKDAAEKDAIIKNVRQAHVDGVVSKETYLKVMVNEGVLDKDFDIPAELRKVDDASIGFRQAAPNPFEKKEEEVDGGEAPPIAAG